MSCKTSASQLGRELYHAIWKEVGVRFYDTSRLSDWASWEHRFEDAIDCEQTAIRFAREAIASLGDPYTKLRDKPRRPSVPQVPVKSANAAAANVTAFVSESGIGYIRILSFEDPDVVSQVKEGLEKIASCNGFILDLRYNPGGLMPEAMDCLEFFLRSGEICTVETRTADGIKRRTTLLTPEGCEWKDTAEDGTVSTELYKRHQPIVYGKPMVILLSAITASSSELVACALIINGFKGMVATVGKTTLGKGIGQGEWIDLGKVELRVSICRWLVPVLGQWLGDGATAGDGIEPDFEVPNDKGPEGLDVAVEKLKEMIAALRADLAAAKK